MRIDSSTRNRKAETGKEDLVPGQPVKLAPDPEAKLSLLRGGDLEKAPRTPESMDAKQADTFALATRQPEAGSASRMPGKADRSLRRSKPLSTTEARQDPDPMATPIGGTMTPGKKAVHPHLGRASLPPEVQQEIHERVMRGEARVAELWKAKDEFVQAQKDWQEHKPGATWNKVLETKRRWAKLYRENRALTQEDAEFLRNMEKKYGVGF